ncbi:hypothetical protein EXIGLDRAFT_750323 [Exidia glandulosa HHB12029]|uniref:AAA-ATPase-like domain-containing protein n=1 Tax=Exidia glandulosa HHB12029 TaxID=1314781 RepID=A0A165GW61_EXIGL|nr:hypothetical protein EXIGLDRAFT_750323 [Exidia glandulosa HHB12029]
MDSPVRVFRCGLTNHDDYVFAVYLDEQIPPTTTIGDLLRLMTQDHAQTCGCSVRVGGEVWYLNSMVETFEPTSHPVPVTRTLGEINRGLEPDAVHLVVVGHPGNRSLLPVHPPDFLPPCEVIEHNDAGVLKLAGTKPLLPDDTCVNYAEMCTTKGLIVVDKTRFVLPQFSQPDPSRLAVLRRPAGFGKTTLLSVLTTYFDVACLPAYYSNMDCDEIPPHLDYLDNAARMMILHMDFAELRFVRTMSQRAMFAECDRFLGVVGTNFVKRYVNILPDVSPVSDAGYNYYSAIYRARDAGYEVFLAIDNYTAPFSDAQYALWEDIIGLQIINPILQDFAEGRIRRGIMVGTDLGTYTPFGDWEHFQQSTQDLTRTGELSTAFGLTPDEVQALGAAADIDNLLADVHRASAHSQDQQTAIIAGNSLPIFCTRDILALARQRLEPHQSPSSALVTVTVIHVPLQNVVDSEESERGDSDDTLVDDEIEQSLRGSYAAKACPSGSPPRKVAVVQVAEEWLGGDDDMGYEPFDDDWS